MSGRRQELKLNDYNYICKLCQRVPDTKICKKEPTIQFFRLVKDVVCMSEIKLAAEYKIRIEHVSGKHTPREQGAD